MVVIPDPAAEHGLIWTDEQRALLETTPERLQSPWSSGVFAPFRYNHTADPAGFLALVVARFGESHGDECVTSLAEFPREAMWPGSEVIPGLLVTIGTESALRVLLSRADDHRCSAGLYAQAVLRPHRTLQAMGSVVGPDQELAKVYVQRVLHLYPGIADRYLDRSAELPAFAAALAERTERLETHRFDQGPVAEFFQQPPWEQQQRKRPTIPAVVDAQVNVPEPRFVAAGGLDPIELTEQQLDEERTYLMGATSISLYRLLRIPSGLFAELLARPGWELEIWGWGGDGEALIELLERHGTIAWPLVERAITEHPHAVLSSFASLGLGAIGPVAARMLSKRLGRVEARMWLLRYPEYAAAGLVPAALQRSSNAARTDARRALRFLATSGHRETVERVAATGGPDVAKATRAVMEADPLEDYPARLPAVPEWADPTLCTSLRLADGNTADVRSLQTVITMLRFTDRVQPYAGIELARNTFTSASLARLSDRILALWQAAGFPKDDGWVLAQVGLIGDARSARQLPAMLTRWPSLSQSNRAYAALDALAAMGSTTALLELHRISRSAKSAPLRKQASLRLDLVATARHMSADELADHLVPTLELEANGQSTICIREQNWRVRFDDTLVPFLQDPTSPEERRTSIPPDAQGDQSKIEEATARWKTIKKESAAALKTMLPRLESTFATRRRWSIESFVGIWVEHPFTSVVGRRLLWGHYVDGTLTQTFRVAEDGTFANVHDEAIELLTDTSTRTVGEESEPPVSEVGLVHPLEIPGEIDAWINVFADYQIVAPIDQLGRMTFQSTDSERASGVIDRHCSKTVHFGKLAKLAARGWVPGEVVSQGLLFELTRTIPGGFRATLSLTEGLYPRLTAPDGATKQLVLPVAVSRQRSVEPVALDNIDSVAVSELLLDLESLRT
jgi:hypothetical protein